MKQGLVAIGAVRPGPHCDERLLGEAPFLLIQTDMARQSVSIDSKLRRRHSPTGQRKAPWKKGAFLKLCGMVVGPVPTARDTSGYDCVMRRKSVFGPQPSGGQSGT